MSGITPCLWFDTKAEEAARFYMSVFPGSRIVDVAHYGYGRAAARGDGHDRDVRPRWAAVRGPERRARLHVRARPFPSRWTARHRRRSTRTGATLSEGGEEGPCGWLKDRYGLSWQIVPRRLSELLADPDREKAQRVMAAMLQMGKIDIAGLERAAAA